MRGEAGPRRRQCRTQSTGEGQPGLSRGLQAELRVPSTDAGRAASLRAIAAQLNEEGHRTRSGAEWTAGQVRRVLTKLAPASS